MTLEQPHTDEFVDELTSNEVPHGYWNRMVDEIKQAPSLPDDSHITDPEPIV